MIKQIKIILKLEEYANYCEIIYLITLSVMLTDNANWTPMFGPFSDASVQIVTYLQKRI